MSTKFATMIIADISESTSLYKAVGENEAQLLIQQEIDRLRNVLLAHGGIPVGQKGDDVLSYFDDPDAALMASLQLIDPPEDAVLSVHVGIHCGPIVIAEKGIYGEAVNVTARLASAANPGEACISEGVFKMLDPAHQQLLKPIGLLRLKGITDPFMAYSLISPTSGASLQTRLPLQFGRRQEQLYHGETLTLLLRHEDRTWHCRNNGELTIGRAPDCDVVLPQPWVSRFHAVISMKAGKLTLADRSTSGTYVKSDAGREIHLKRESVMLADSGVISPTMPLDSSEAHLQFEVLRHRDALRRDANLRAS